MTAPDGRPDRAEQRARTCPHGLAVRVLPEDVAVVEETPSDRTAELYPGELESIARAIPVRRWEFSTGRACARAALERIGVPPSEIPSDANRAPVWPDGVVGALSHTRAHCAAAVTLRERHASLGLDIEVERTLDDPVLRRICTEGELRALAGGPPSSGVLVFSAKECFYKLQFPLTGTFLGFHAVEVDLDHERGAFRVRVITDALGPAWTDPLEGRFALCCGLVATGMTARP